ncbi:MAG: IS1595 family transposase [Terriglobales bacterium]
MAKIPTKEACQEYLERLRWPAGFRCARCGSAEAWRVRALWECAGCGYQNSVTAGTIFQDTRIPLPVWFRAMWWVSGQTNAATALGLQRELELKRYETAWTMLRRLRRAMVRPGRDLLTGRVELDGCNVRCEEKGLGGALNLERGLIFIAAEEQGSEVGRIRMRHVVYASTASLVAFVQDSVAPGSVLLTNDVVRYRPLESRGYYHEVRFPERRKKDWSESEAMPRVRKMTSALKQWLMESQQGAVSRKLLDDYLDEFTFQFNLRQSERRGELFLRLAQQAVTADPVPSDRIVDRNSANATAKPQSDGAT